MQKDLANAIRFLSIDMIEKANSGHPGMPLGMADVATILFEKHLRFNPNDPDWYNRDRLVLSAGHGSALLYSCLYLSGYKEMTIEELKNFRCLGSKTPGHTEYNPSLSIEATTGPLGQGIAMAVGMAMSERILNARFSGELVDHKIYAICGDGCLAEGIGQEAISIAGHYALKNLIILFDDNGITIDGPTTLSTSENHIARVITAGWNAVAVDGHDAKQIDEAILNARHSNKPTLIACKTTIGFGVPNIAGTNKMHGAAIGQLAAIETRKAMQWEHDEFDVPTNILNEWRSFWLKSEQDYVKWTNDFLSKGQQLRDYLENKDLKNMDSKLFEFKKELISSNSFEATRVSSGKILEFISKNMSNLIGGSADLTLSNNTKSSNQSDINSRDYKGSYINYGEREHVMAAIMNGISLSGALIPYGGTFLVFSDYARPAMRLSALMKLGVIYVMTHDSIGLGEDGATHQPVEHLASYRAMPNILVLRPCDAIETFEAWQLALNSRKSPSIIALTRQKVKQIEREYEINNINMVGKGAYIIKQNIAEFKVTIFATGSEVEIAIDIANILEELDYGTKVVSVPCMELFHKQDAEYQMQFTCNSSFKVAIEAGAKLGWEGLIGPHGYFFGVEDFGESAPANILYEHFGLTKENISSKIISILQQRRQNG